MNPYRHQHLVVTEFKKVTYRSDWDDVSYSFNLVLDSGARAVGLFRLSEQEVPLVQQWFEAEGRLFYDTMHGTRIPGVEHRLYWLVVPGSVQGFCHH